MVSVREVGIHPVTEMNRLVRGSASRAEQSLAIRHLLTGCSTCAQRVAREVGWDPSPEPVAADDPWIDSTLLRPSAQSKAGRDNAVRDPSVQDGASPVEAMLQRVSSEVASWVETVRRESNQVEDLAEALAQGSLEDPLSLLETLPARQRRNLCERLVEHSIAARLENPKVTLRCAELAVAVASDALDAEAVDDLAELRVRAWAELGNARRINNDLAGSDAAFTIAGKWLDEVPQCDPLLKAEFLSLLASLRDYQRRLKDALILVRQAAVIYERHGSDDAVAKVRIKEASILAKAGDVQGGLRAVWSGLKRMGPDADLSVVVAGIHNLIHLMVDRGAYAEAAHLVEAVKPLYRRFAGRMVELRLDWLKARIDLETKGPAVGARSLEAIRVRFLDEDLPFETAVVSLELAQIYASTGDMARLHEVAGAMVPIFQQLGTARDLIAALTTLRAASAREEANLRVIEQLRHGLGVEGVQTL